MTTSIDPATILPNPRIPKRIGFWNVVFGAILTIYGLFQIALVVMAPTLKQWSLRQYDTSESVRKAEKEAKIAELEATIKSAESKEERENAVIELGKADLDDSSTASGTIAVDKEMEELSRIDPVDSAYFNVLIISMLILNPALIVSGIGLLGLSDRARKFCIGIATLKILRLASLSLFYITILFPIEQRQIYRTYDTIETRIHANIAKTKGVISANDQRKLDMVRLLKRSAPLQSMFMKALGPVTAVLGSIYPAICIWFLTRPEGVAACRTRKPAGTAPGDFA